MLEASNITFVAGSCPLISDFSAKFEPGRLHLLIGPNGAGKSTLIKVLARLHRPQHGSVTYEGVDVSTAKELDLAKRRAVLSQAVEVAFPLSVREVVMMGRYPHFGGRPGDVDEQIVNEVMPFFDIEELEERDYQTLSGGERQRVNFARVLAQVWRPSAGLCRYLFLDEPLTFLDIRHQIEFMKKVQAFSRAVDVVAVGVVHDLNLAARFAERLVLLNEGRVIAAGGADAVLTADNIRSVFGVEPTFVATPKDYRYLIFD
jgi:iron complex transport system ATP-binding protein